MASFVNPPLLKQQTGSQGADSLEDRISLSMSDMQKTRQIGCKRQCRRRRVGERKWKKTKEGQRVTGWRGDETAFIVGHTIKNKGWKSGHTGGKNERKRSRRKLRWGISDSFSQQASQPIRETALYLQASLIFCQVRLGNCPQQWQLMGHPLHTRQLLYFTKMSERGGLTSAGAD